MFCYFQGTDDVHIAWENIKNAVKVTPTMVFSVIGDSDSFVPRPWPRTVFQTALIEAAKSGGGNLRGKKYDVQCIYGLFFKTSFSLKENSIT